MRRQIREPNRNLMYEGKLCQWEITQSIAVDCNRKEALAFMEIMPKRAYLLPNPINHRIIICPGVRGIVRRAQAYPIS